MGKIIDITGQRFGRLTVIEQGKHYKGMVFWKCKCDCGNIIEASSGHLRYGHTKSCGCYGSDVKRHPNKIVLTDDFGKCYFNTGGFFYFDKEDYDLIKKYCWVKSSAGYAMTHRYGGKTIMCHRLITDCPDKLVVDHINHNTLDNRKSNLRVCEVWQNTCNHKAKGVAKRNNRWEASITCKGKYIYLGRYDTEKEAIYAREEGEKKYFGEFAYKKNKKEETNE